MKEKIAKLIDVKTIVTIALVGAVIVFTANSKIALRDFPLRAK
ncbi:hypothetical protein Cpap_1257 [Ruminiclostridium papyrosolvens DSM 2782]|uniref:Uncharacterized protein n=1 Tax=Ruminiclostridium papyrosolvens DSM 2782 TaxID=588581 RepID=F1TFI7_9FIRM|nr:hypothetical protein [Ruminiclostridium papyrosolvens]EGD46719.1 hypothetical protein Cpap_1257 [Ruminiclostridium papyrosolvens DSM 2782]WES36664.1 hypothetical protein P0092_02860 [Ruminiclostridium papyrosolvens DSM 2782]